MNFYLLPDLRYPVDHRQAEALWENMGKLNVLDAGHDERTQRAIGILLDAYEVAAKKGPSWDYVGSRGAHQRLIEDAVKFAGPGTFVTRHGDLAACHLAIDWNNSVITCDRAKYPEPPNNVTGLVSESRFFSELPPQLEVKIDLYLRYLKKKSLWIST